MAVNARLTLFAAVPYRVVKPRRRILGPKGCKGTPVCQEIVVAIGFDPTLLFNYYAAKLPLSPVQNSAQIIAPLTPWDIRNPKPPQQTQDVAVRSATPYFDPTDRSLLAPANATGTANATSQLEALLNSQLSNNSSAAGNTALAADNHKLFGLYKALDRLDYIAKMANRDGTLDGQRVGLNQNFQDGITQVLAFVKKASFANLTVMPGQKTSSEQSDVSIAYPKSNYTGGAVTGDTHVFDPVPGLSA